MGTNPRFIFRRSEGGLPRIPGAFQQRERLVRDGVLHTAGILVGCAGVYAAIDEHIGKEAVAFKDPICDPAACLCQVEEHILIGIDEIALLENRYSIADAGL